MESLTEIFKTYSGFAYFYTNIVAVDEINRLGFHEMLGHRRALGGKSVAMTIHEATEKFVGGFAGKKVLDVGCRLGHFSFLAAEDGAEVVGVDFEELQVKAAREIASMKGLNKTRFLAQRVEDLDYSTWNKFDLALVLNVFDHMLRANGTEGLESLRRISENAGKMVLMMGPHELVFSQAEVPGTVLHYTSYSEKKLLVEDTGYGGRSLWGFER